MLESMEFNFDNTSTKDMGVVMVQDGNGLYKEAFLPSRKIIEKSVAGRNAPYLQRVDDEPLSFSIPIFIEDWKERNSLRAIARWLYTDGYEPLWFGSEPERIFYAIVEGKPELIHNGLNEGYVILPFRCNSAYGYSPKRYFNATINGSLDEQLFNEGDRPMRFKMKITKHGNGDISITNNENGQVLAMKNLLNGEVATVDCVNESISSSLEYTGRYLVDSHNDVWLDIEEYSSAIFTFTGNFTIELEYQYIYLQEYDVLEP